FSNSLNNKTARRDRRKLKCTLLMQEPGARCVRIGPQGRKSMATIFQDLRYAARTLWKSPGFTAIAVIALALGIGANTAMFSIVNGVLLRPIQYSQPERLLKLYTSAREFRNASVSYPNYLDWQQRSQSFETLAAYRNETFNLTGQGEPER